MAALREQERAIEATYPAVPPFVRAHSLLWHNTAHSGDSAESTVASWLLCFEGCPVPLERALVVLRLLARLHAAPPAPARRVLRVLERPLEDCLSSVSRADLAAMVQVADYLQLPKALVARVTQHRAARALRVAFASTADLLAAVRDGPLRPLLRTSLAALPDPFSATPPPEQFAEVSPDLDDDPAAGPEVGPLTPQEQLQRLHADPCFLRGVCNAPYEHEVGCTCEDPLSIYLAGLLLAGHPLPSRLMESNVAVIAAVAVGNTTALGRMMENSGADPRTLSIIPFGEVAMNAAAYFGRTELLESLLSKESADANFLFHELLSGAAERAAAGGQLAALQLLCDRGCVLSKKVAAAAAGAGHLAILQWLRSRGCHWDGNTLARAAAGDHREVFEWAIAEGCPRDARACAGAASTGNLALLRWLRDQGFEWDVRCYVAAAKGGHFNVMRYAREHGCDWGAGNAVCAAAARGGSVEMLQWCVDHGAAWGPRTCEAAATGGHAGALKFALGRGCPINERAAAAAAHHGHARCLALSFEHDGGRFTHPWILRHAEHSQQAECVKLAIVHGCKDMSGEREPGAVWGGGSRDFAMIQWLLDRAAASGKDVCARVTRDICCGAAFSDRLGALRGMLGDGYLDLADMAPALSALDGLLCGPPSWRFTLETLGFLYENGMRFDASVFERAAARGSIEVLTWLRDVAKCPLSPAVWDAAAEDAAEDADAIDVLKWLCVLPTRPWDDKLVLWALREADEELLLWAMANEPDAAAALRTRGRAEAMATGWIRSVMIARKHGVEWGDVSAEGSASALPELSEAFVAAINFMLSSEWTSGDREALREPPQKP